MLLAAAFAWTAAGQTPGALNPATPPTTRVTNCMTSGCHAKETTFPFVHGPTAVGACDACHEYQDPAKHTFRVKRDGRDLCSFCHIDKSASSAPFVHKPFADGDCAECHNPHGGATRALLQKATTTDLCLSCHQGVMSGSHAHKPAAENCTSCHSPHTSSHAKLLPMERRALCLSCHAEVGKTIAGAPHPHKPTEGECLQCHSAHASDHAKVLVKSAQELCVSCHEGVGKTIAAATHPHGAVTDARSCLNCHTPHGSTHAKMLLPDPVGACLECHKKPIVVSPERTVPAAPEVAVEAFHRHGPIVQGQCTPCHNVHGATNTGLLVRPYEKSFYQTYSDEAYGLCFGCHDRASVMGTAGGGPTGFRNGERNLHAVHVGKQPQGRSCRACHTVHASRNEVMIADTVTFGQWNLPLNFTKLETGGSCAPGCHKPETYDRGVKK